jgi:hypothetical protein
MASPLLALPDELLLSIALDVDVHDLHSLLRTHRCFRAVAKEGLICKARTPPHQIFELIKTLDANPTIVKRMKHLRFASLTVKVHEKINKLGPMYHSRMGDKSCAAACAKIEKAHLSPDNVAWKHAVAEIEDFYSVVLSLLIAQTSDATALTLGINTLDAMPLTKRIFRADTGVNGYGYQQTLITSKPFSHLKVLSVSVWAMPNR